jgi:hypothetical protein
MQRPHWQGCARRVRGIEERCESKEICWLAGLNQIDIQTAVYDREKYSLYGNKRTSLWKCENKPLLTGAQRGTGMHVNDEMKTRTHDLWKHEANRSVYRKKGHGSVLQTTYYKSDTACLCNWMCQVQFHNGQAVWSMADLRCTLRVGNIGKGCSVNKGLEVRSNSSTVCEMNSRPETWAQGQVNWQKGEENNGSKCKWIRSKKRSTTFLTDTI